MLVTVTGGSGYIGAVTCAELAEAGHEVRCLDSLLHGQRGIFDELQERGVELIEADVRDEDARGQAVEAADAVVHLAAIVGDPACAHDPERSREVNVDASRALIADAAGAGVERFVFASTCSNYGRMADPTVPIDETAPLAPVSLYAEQKVEVERLLLEGRQTGGLKPTCLRFATIYGVAPRMRFDLTVNEFTRELWAERELEVYGEYFWRPYVHVADAARAIRTVLEKPADEVAEDVFNVGRTDENYRKLDLVELIVERLGRGDVSFVSRDEDPRDYKVDFSKIKDRLGFEPALTVPDGIDEIVRGLEAKQFDDPFDRSFSNVG
jgi:nucleoside-diphosphate-sugar epimerase